MVSRNNTVISQPGQSIVDAYNTSWSIVGGQVAVNGVADPSTNRVTQLAYVNGRVWQQNTDNLWWSKTGSFTPTWNPPGGTPANPLPASPDNSVIGQPDQFIVDAAGKTWTIVGGQVAVNGVIDPSTNRVTVLAYEHGQIWQENVDRLWWSKSAPSDGWNPPGGSSTSPLTPSANNTVITQPNQFIVDAAGRTWSIVGGQVAVDGSADPSTNRVTELAYENGRIWQENTDNLWWSKSAPSDSWNPPGGTPASPVQNLSRTWFGGTGPFATGIDWIGGVAPQPGDTAVVKAGVVAISPGNATGVGFLLAGPANASASAPRPELKFLSGGPNAAGTVTVQQATKGTLLLEDGYAPVAASVAGIHLSDSQLNITEFQGVPLTVTGNSSLDHGAALSVSAFNGGEPPTPAFVNDGTLTIDASTAALGKLSGHGTVSVANGGSLAVDSATAGETIQLSAGHLDVFGARDNSPFLASITDFGATSSAQLWSAHVLAAQNPYEAFVKSAPTAGELFIYEGKSVLVDVHVSGQAAIYASAASNQGGVVLTAYDTGHSFPIVHS